MEEANYGNGSSILAESTDRVRVHRNFLGANFTRANQNRASSTTKCLKSCLRFALFALPDFLNFIPLVAARQMGSGCFRPKPEPAPLLTEEDLEPANAEERQQLHSAVEQHKAPSIGTTDEEKRHFALHQLLCTDSVKYQMSMQAETLARPCGTQKHGCNGKISFEVVVTFVGQDFRQAELNTLSEDTLFVDDLFAHTGLDAYQHKGLRLWTVPSNTDAILYSVCCSCACGSE